MLAAAATTTVDDNDDDDNALKFHPQQVSYFFLANTTESFWMFVDILGLLSLDNNFDC